MNLLNKYLITFFTLSILLVSVPVSAGPFEDCPTEAFLIQTPANVTIAYGVDLSTGSYATLSPDMQTSKVNGVGFNFHDNYMYGWDYSAATLARIGSDFLTQPLNVTSGLIGQNFYVGDVSVNENIWYGYRSKFGLYKIDLATPEQDLTMVQVATSTAMGNPILTDFAFHPTNGLIYAVDNNGFLLTIDANDGTTTTIGEVLSEPSAGFNFTFGAQYFDVNNNLYISNNSNGYVYKIDLNQATPQAVFFAYGPISQSNDGARCALAPVVSELGLDFGDAPDSYSTSFDSSGPRHGESLLYLGDSLDTESDAYVYPLSDDDSDGNDDDDGVSFVTGLEVNESAMIVANASEGNGYLNAWIDWDQDGEFTDDEKIITDEALDAGNNSVIFSVPSWAEPGATWSRFRISTLTGIGPTGGVSDGEVEDYLVSVTESNTTINYYPSSNGYTTVAYEDLWPIEGDFDMNDLLMNLRIAEVMKGSKIIRIEIEGKIAALGASYNNGFAIQLPTIPTSAIRASSIELTINDVIQNETVLESNQTYAVLVVTQNTWDITNAGEGTCRYFRTEAGCGTALRPTWKLVVPLASSIDERLFPEPPYDPFIFSTPNRQHGSFLASLIGSTPGRAWEVHLKNKVPTDTFNSILFGEGEDQSNIGSSYYFQNSQGMPWALEVPEDWKHPIEKQNIRLAYPEFSTFATSSGESQADWYIESKANSALIFQD